MAKSKSAIAEYEELLIGKKTSANFSFSGSPKEKEESAIEAWRYAINDLLHWTPQEAAECMNTEIINMLHLDVTLRYIDFPKDLIREKDFDYIVHLAFPKEVKYDPKAQVIRLYLRILNGEKEKFPKKYFDGEQGQYKAASLLLYVIANNIPASSIPELYQMFADSAKMNNRFKEWKIYDVCHNSYASPLEYLHNSLPSSQRDDFLYKYYDFNAVYKVHVAEMRRMKNKQKKDSE